MLRSRLLAWHQISSIIYDFWRLAVSFLLSRESFSRTLLPLLPLLPLSLLRRDNFRSSQNQKLTADCWKFRNCLVVWEIIFIFAGSKMSFCRKTIYILTTAAGAKSLVLMGLRLCRRRVSQGLWVWICHLRIERKTVFRVGKRGGYLDTKGRSFCLSVVEDGCCEKKLEQNKQFLLTNFNF